jgi:hypothetical protein
MVTDIPALIIVKRYHQARQFLVRTGDNALGRHIDRDLDLVHRATVDRQPLQDSAIAARVPILKDNVPAAPRRRIRIDQFHLPRVVPSGNHVLLVGSLLKRAVFDRRACGIGLDVAFLFGRSGHGDKQSRAKRLGLQLTAFLAVPIQGLLVSFADRNHHDATVAQLID